jgi:hypothetical protein
MNTPNDIIPLPPQFGSDPLSGFLKQAFENRLATFHNSRPAFERLARIEKCFGTICSNLNEPKGHLIAFLLVPRSHAAYLAACEHACASQIAEVFPMTRVCLEHAAYSLHIKNTTDAGVVWVERHKDQAALKRAKDEFKLGRVAASVAKADSNTGAIFQRLYQQSIDRGAHPNEKGLTSSMSLERPDKNTTRFQTAYFRGPGVALDHAFVRGTGGRLRADDSRMRIAGKIRAARYPG